MKKDYHICVPQGNCLSLILVILSVNSLSFLLKTLNGCKIDTLTAKKTKISHLFFVANLKTVAQNWTDVSLQLDLITAFINNSRMQFWLDKTCMFIVKEGSKLSLHNVKIAELAKVENWHHF